jgi:hypothetical protein
MKLSNLFKINALAQAKTSKKPVEVVRDHVLINQEPKEELKVFSKTLPLTNLISKALDIQHRCEDFTIPSSKIYVPSFGDSICFSDSFEEDHDFRFTQHSLSQLCGKLEVPVRFIKKNVRNHYDSLNSNILNTYLEGYDKDLFIRTYDDKVRGVLSDKYSVLDTPDILDVLKDTTSEDYRVKSYMMNEERFHARLLLPHMLDIEGEDLFPGVQIDSSDVGRNILLVKVFIYKQVCTNGLVMPQGGGVLYEQKHIGITADDFKKELKENLDLVEPLVAEFTAMIKENRKAKITTETVSKLVDQLKTELNVSEETQKKVISLLDEKYSKTKWGLINAITEVAQDFTLERRLALESFASNILVA